MKLPETERNQLNSCQTAGLDIFCKANRDSCLKYVQGVQRRLDRAVADGDNREISKTRNKILQAPIMEKLFKSQKGRCAYCKQIFDGDLSATHKHHLRPRSEGGDWKLGNLRLLHSECHTSLHSLFSRKEMADLADKKIDYIRLMKSVS